MLHFRPIYSRYRIHSANSINLNYFGSLKSYSLIKYSLCDAGHIFAGSETDDADKSKHRVENPFHVSIRLRKYDLCILYFPNGFDDEQTPY